MNRARIPEPNVWQAEERGSQDWRMVPAAVGVWMAALACHTLMSMFTAAAPDRNSMPVLPAAGLALVWSLLGAGVCRAVTLIRRIPHSVRTAVAIQALMVTAAMLIASLSVLSTELAQWRDPAAAHLREGPQPVILTVHTTGPVLASTMRDADCQIDATTVQLNDRMTVRPSHIPIRIFAPMTACTRMTQGATLRCSGQLASAEFGTIPYWLHADGVTVHTVRAPSAFRQAIGRAQEAFFRSTEQLPDQGRILVPGLTLGMPGQRHNTVTRRSGQTDQAPPPADSQYAGHLEQAFQQAGIMHLMAVSGGHFALIAALVRRSCMIFLLPRAVVALTVAAAHLLLAAAMVPSDSVVRACAMGLISAAAFALGRRPQPVSALAWSVIIIILINPAMAYSYGFALSCAAVMSILLLAAPLTRVCACLLPRPMAAALGITMAAQAGTLPIQVLMEPALPVLSIPANLLVTPCVGVATIAGLGALAVSWWWDSLGVILARFASCGTLVMERVALWLGDSAHATLPWAGGIPGALLIAGMELAVGALSMLVCRLRARRTLHTPADHGFTGKPFVITPRERYEAWARDAIRSVSWRGSSILSSDPEKLKPWHKRKRPTRL